MKTAPAKTRPMPEPTAHLVSGQAAMLSNRLIAQREQLSPPAGVKQMRRFSCSETANLLGVKDAFLRRLSLDGRGPMPEVTPTGRRLYSSADLMALRHFLEPGARKGSYLPGRRGNDHLQVITVINFKGGSAKTTTAAHLAQKCALDGYRVLAIDLDPQASLSALHGIQPELDVGPGQTLYGAIRDGDRQPLRTIIRPTHITNLDLVPANLELAEFGHDTPKTMAMRGDNLFFTRLSEALAEVEAEYDLVIIDCPPQLDHLAMMALSSATALLITVHPQMLDVMSMSLFLEQAGRLLEETAEAGGQEGCDWLRYVLTRYEPDDRAQSQMVSFIRATFNDYVLPHEVLKSTVISDAAMTRQTLYEVERSDFHRSTFDRAIKSVDAVNADIQALIQKAWGR